MNLFLRVVSNFSGNKDNNRRLLAIFLSIIFGLVRVKDFVLLDASVCLFQAEEQVAIELA